MSFRKLSAKGEGRLIRRYFTEDRPEPDPERARPGMGHNGGPVLEPGERLTAYYTGRDGRATWRADMPWAVAHALGIDPTRMPKDRDLDRLFEARRADTGAAWSEHEREISAYDFTFSPHKSVTLAAEFAPTPAEAAAIRNAVWRANDAAMRLVARELGWARKGHGGEDGADPGAVGWTSFYHHTARPTLAVQDGPEGVTYLADAPVGGDPFDHVHNALFNLVVTEDGRIGSLDTKRLHARVHEFGAYGQAVLADELRRLGIRVGHDKNEQAIVVEAVPERANDAFSKSRKQVLRGAKAFAGRQGLDWDELSAARKFEILHEAAVADRLAKHDGKDDRALWREQAAAIGWAHETVLDEVRHVRLSDAERHDLAYAFAARHVEAEFHTAAVIDHDRLRLHAARALIGTGIDGPEDIDRVVELLETRGIELRGEHVALVVGMADDRVRVTNTAQVRIEEGLAARAKRASLDTSGALSAEAIRAAVARSGLDFTGDHGRAQLAAIHALGQGGALTALTGAAGVGKTAIMRPLVAAWKADTRFDAGGREVIGVATAWRQADALCDPGLDIASVVDRTYALQPLMAAIAAGEFVPTRNTVLVVDEMSQIGPRPMLRLLELQARTGMTVKVLGDREQAQAIEAGDTVEIFRRALSNQAMPELLSTVRQVGRTAAEGARLREIAGLFRGTELGEYATLEQRREHHQAEVTRALGMKRQDGTAMLVGGDHDQVVGRIADLYLQRRDILAAAGSKKGVTISVPTNEDAADVSRAVRERLKARGEIGADEAVYRAIDQRGETYDLPIATGDRLRLYRRTWARMSDGRGGSIGNNGDVVEVVGHTGRGLLLRSKGGRVGEVEWRRMADPKTGRLLLGFGHALTIDAAQGLTSDEHIDALPRGTDGVTGFKAYVAESRARGVTWTLIAAAALHEAVKRDRALGDASPVTDEHLWARAAKDLAAKPYKALGMDLARGARADRERAVDAFIQQAQRIQAMEAEGEDPGQEARRRARDLTAERAIAGRGTALDGAVRRAGAELRGMAKDAMAQEQSRRVRDWLREREAGARPGAGDRYGGGARRLAQAEAVRRALERHVPALDEALRRNGPKLAALGQGVDAHLRGMREEAEAARRRSESVSPAPSSSPSPGM